MEVNADVLRGVLAGLVGVAFFGFTCAELLFPITVINL